jgi:replicative DNA helicase
MDIEVGALWAILRSQEVYHQALARGMSTADFERPAHRKAFKFIGKHVTDTDNVPGLDAVAEICDIEIRNPGLDPLFILGEMDRRRRFKKVVEVLEAADVAVRANDPDRVVALLEQFLEEPEFASKTEPDSLLSYGDKVIESYNLVKAGHMGVPFPWEPMNLMTMGMWKRGMTIFVARPSTGKCVRYDTPILDPVTGQYRTIREVVDQQRMVLTRSADRVPRAYRPDAFLNTGRKMCWRMELNTGRELFGTPEHPVMTADGWKRLDEIRTGDFVEVARCVPEPLEPVVPTVDEAVLLAALIADGGYTSDAVTFSKEDPVVLERFRVAAASVGCKLNFNAGTSYRVVREKKEGVNGARDLLDRYGCGNTLSKEKRIPAQVFSFCNDRLSDFLGMLWSCDGSIEASDQITYSSASHGLAVDVQRLLLRFGIVSTCHKKHVKCNGKPFVAWELFVVSTCFEAFKRHIRLVGIKAERLAAVVRGNGKRACLDNVPTQGKVGEEIRRIVAQMPDRERIARLKVVQQALGMTTPFSADKIYRRRTVSRRVFAAFVDAFEMRDLASMLNCYWDEVVDIREDVESDVYDLTVHDGHCFIANDITVHNTFVAVILARYAWLMGYPVLFVSPEMSKEEIAERFFTIDAEISALRAMRGMLSEFELQKLIKTVDERRDQRGLWIMDYTDDLTPRGIENAIRKVKPAMVAIDTMYNLRFPGDKFERIEKAMDWLGGCCKRFDFAALAFSQENRTREQSAKFGGGAKLGNIAFSDQIAMDAHAIFSLHQDPDMKADKVMRIIPLKLRRGFATGPLDVRWDLDRMEFPVIEQKVSTGYDDEDGDGGLDSVPF